MKRSFVLLAVVCSVSFAIAAEKKGKAKPSSAAQKSEANANNPQYGKWGFDSAGADFKAKGGDDFFRDANGTWLDHTQIPPDKSAYSLRLAMTDRTEQRLHEILEDAAKTAEPTPSTIEGKVGAFYKSFMDEAAVEKAGAMPLKQKIDVLRTINDRVALGAAMGRQNSDLEGGIFSLGLDVDIGDPNRYIIYLGQAGLGLPDRDYYLKPDFAAQKTKYRAYVAQLLKLVDWPEPEKSAADVVDFETKIADASWTKSQQRDPVA